jgi:hypothetical protein
MRLTPLLLVLTVTACKVKEIPIEPPIGEWVKDADSVVSFVVEDGVGPAPASTMVRAVNQYGAAIQSDPESFDVGGASQSASFDGLGYGTLTLTEPGVAEINGGEEKATLYAMASQWPGFGLLPVSEAMVSGAGIAEPVSTGTLVAAGSEVWWVGPNQDGHRVLRAGGAILGLQSGHIDVDGVMDAVAWTDSIVFLLRGRVGGGMAWAGGVTTKDFAVGGAAIGELNGDNLPDLAIAWAAVDGVSMLDVWNGDGLLSFTPAEPRSLPRVPISISIGDQTGEGRNQITVLNDDASWARFIGGTELKYMPIGPSTPEEIAIVTNSTVDSRGDLNNDGAEEMYFLGPLNPSSTRSIFIVDLLGPKIEFLPLNDKVAAYVTKNDADGNGIVDLFMLQETQSLDSLSFDETSTNAYDPRRLVDLPDHGPITLHDVVDVNNIPDLFLAGDPFWWWWQGYNDPADVDVFWRLHEPSFEEVATSSEGPFSLVELDGDPGTTEFVVFQLENGDTYLKIFQLPLGAESAIEIGAVEVSDLGVEALDIAVCDHVAWVAMAGELVRVNMFTPTAPSVSATLPSLGTRVDCGTAPSGAVAAFLSDGIVQLLDANLVELSTVSAVGALDVAIGDLGNGPEIRTCTDAGCSIVAWNAGPGLEGFAIGTPERVSLVGNVGNSTVVGHGQVSTADVDGNGFDDLVTAGVDGLVSVHRSNGTTVVKAELFHTIQSLSWPVGVSDTDGDGFGDLWGLDGDGELHHSVAPRIAGPEGSGTDTSDTGVGSSTTDTSGGTGP